MIAEEKQNKWRRREAQLTNPNPPSGSQIRADERKNAFQRAADARNVEAIDDARSEASPAQRWNQRGLKKTESVRNRFQDPQFTKDNPATNPRDKIGPTEGKRTAATEWHGASVPRSNSGRPLDEETLRLKEAADADRIKRVQAKERAKLGLPAEKKPLAPKDNSFEDLQAMALYTAAAFPEILFDVPPTADENLKRIAKQNSQNLAHMWRWLVFKGLVKNDLAGLLAAVEQCKLQNAFDDGKPRVRGFGNRELINIIPPPPDAPENSAVNEALDLVRSGQARLQRMRPPTDDEVAERARLRAMPFSELKKAATGE